MKPERAFWVLLAVLWAGLIYAAYAFDLPERLGFGSDGQPSAPETAIANAGGACDANPPLSGRAFDIDATPQLKKSNNAALIEIDNRHRYPVLAILTSPDGEMEYRGVYLLTGQKASVVMPSGDYGFTVLSGSRWCNLDSGFSDGYAVPYPEQIHLARQSRSSMNLLSFGSTPDAVMFSFAVSGMAQATNSSEIIELSRQIDGHFHVVGSVEGRPVTFMIDSGATSVTIPYSMATEIGLDRNCKPAHFMTAAGRVQGCQAIVQKLTVGGFHFQQMEVSFNKGGETPLLGMSVLSQFRVQQNADTMLISMN
jgi:clan AA aspartic protease (TIGR02281 family)